MRRLTSVFHVGLLAMFGGGAFLASTTTSAARGDEDFQPIKEAELPKDFPGYTPVGKIELKHYPAYRKATASGDAQFWTLFRHIKQNNVAMTAPVEMDYGDPRDEKARQRAMAFLYESPDQGSPGKQGSVEVSDAQAKTVASLGCRGPRTRASLDEARRRLLKWLEENKDSYELAGSMRVMGYNSPFVPSSKQFFEVQVPVKPRTADAGESGLEAIR